MRQSSDRRLRNHKEEAAAAAALTAEGNTTIQVDHDAGGGDHTNRTTASWNGNGEPIQTYLQGPGKGAWTKISTFCSLSNFRITY